MICYVLVQWPYSLWIVSTLHFHSRGSDKGRLNISNIWGNQINMSHFVSGWWCTISEFYTSLNKCNELWIVSTYHISLWWLEKEQQVISHFGGHPIGMSHLLSSEWCPISGLFCSMNICNVLWIAGSTINKKQGWCPPRRIWLLSELGRTKAVTETLSYFFAVLSLF